MSMLEQERKVKRSVFNSRVFNPRVFNSRVFTFRVFNSTVLSYSCAQRIRIQSSDHVDKRMHFGASFV